MQNKLQCDVLVIGGGAAATRAAIEASDNGADVLMATKMEYGYGGSSFYANSIPWGIMTAGEGEDAGKDFLEEIFHASCGCLDKKLAEILVFNSEERFREMVDYGIEFRNNDGTPCFGRKPRGALLVSMDNARKCFREQIRKRGIRVIENLAVHDLIVMDQACYGALGTDRDGNLFVIGSKTAILASGGAEYLWEYGFANADMTGDAYAMAARHGVRLTNLEFIQFIPGVVSPLRRTNFHHPTLESLPLVLNSRGEEFLGKYLPEGVTVEECLKARAGHGPFSYEDHSRYFDIAICREELKNRDDKHPGAEIRYGDAFYQDDRYKTWCEFLASRDVDTRTQNLWIYPHCQGFNGGILIDEHCATDIKNLYACGECAGGPHGANRIGGNAVLGTQVFGKIAGEQAARKSKNAGGYASDAGDIGKTLEASFDTGNISKIQPEEIMRYIKRIMQECAFIVRDGKKLQEGFEKLGQMQKEYNACQYIGDPGTAGKALNAYNSLLTGRAILYSMINRRESRGSHYRADFPEKNGEVFGSMAYVKMDKNSELKLYTKSNNKGEQK